MDRSDIENGIARSWALLEKAGIAGTFSNGGWLKLESEVLDLLLRENASYVDVYLGIIERSNYNMSLTDYACFHFTYQKPKHYRYAFYQNPFAAQSGEDKTRFKRRQDLVMAGFINKEEYISLVRDDQVRLNAPPIRFDCSQERYRPHAHPMSHLHIGHNSQGRWPISRILTPLAAITHPHFLGAGSAASGQGVEDCLKGVCAVITHRHFYGAVFAASGQCVEDCLEGVCALSLAVSTVVRTSASAFAAHMAR